MNCFKRIKCALKSGGYVFVFALFLFGGPAYSADISILSGFSKELRNEPVTGRLFLFVSTTGDFEPRLRKGNVLLFGMDVDKLKPGDKAVFDGNASGYPVESLKDLPEGDYYIQALLNIYTEFHRADGHTIWAHMDQWEGQKFNISPGNFYSEVIKAHIDPSKGVAAELPLTKIIPPVKVPEDTKWVKRIKIQSEILTEFWGHPFYLGATILLPKGYDEHPDVFYPVEYEQTHFGLSSPHGFNPVQLPETEEQKARRLRNSDETGYEFYQQWMSDTFPRMLCVSFQHPTPYYDDSYAVNSANCGPFGDAIMKELIPYIEEHFRIIKEPYARALTGGSTGGWEALALQVYHPEFFGGSWVFFPDPIDFRSYGVINVYEDENAYYIKDGGWRLLERPMNRSVTGQTTNTFKNQCRYESVLGSKNRSCEQIAIWDAVYGPVDADGYPKPLWDRKTGKIDTSVASYMRNNNYDLRYYMEKNWQTLGPLLKDKLHFSCGDMDNLYLNLAVYRMEEFLEKTKEPYYNGSFIYGRPMKGHGWKPANNFETLKNICAYIENNAREHNYPVKWQYDK
jgi:hypothetical protein